MKVLLDEQLPVKLKYRLHIAGEVTTVRDMGWLGMKDQQLFLNMEIEKFDLFITNDQNLKYQVNLNNLQFSLIDLNFKSNRYEDLLSIVPAINKELEILSKAILSPTKRGCNIFIFTDMCLNLWQGE